MRITAEPWPSLRHRCGPLRPHENPVLRRKVHLLLYMSLAACVRSLFNLCVPYACFAPLTFNTMQSANVYEHANDQGYKYDETRFLGNRLRRTDEVVSANCTAHKDTCVRAPYMMTSHCCPPVRLTSLLTSHDRRWQEPNTVVQQPMHLFEISHLSL